MKRLLLLTTLLTVNASAQEIVIEASSPVEANKITKKVVSKTSIKEELDLLPGLSLISLSSSSSPRDLFFLRGFSPERVYVFLDEFPLNSSGIRGNFYIDLSTLEPEVIKKIEVIYGPSVIYGSNPGGNLIVKSKGFPTENSLKITTSTGSYNTFKGKVLIRNNWNSGGVEIFTGGERTDGYLRNDFLNKETGKVTLYQVLGDSTLLKIHLERSRIKDGLPTLNDPNNPKTDYDDKYPTVKETYFSLACAPYCKLLLLPKEGENFIKRNTDRYEISLSKELGNGVFAFTAYFNKSFKRERYYGIFKGKVGFLTLEGKDDRTYGLRTTYEFRNNVIGAELQNSGYGKITKNSTTLVEENYNALKRFALFGEFKKEYPIFSVKAGLRVEKWKSNALSPAPNLKGTELLPTFSISKKFKSFTLFGSVGRVYRPPKAEEILWFSKEYPLLKNYALKPERGWDYEFGVKKVSSSYTTTAIFYTYRINNFIVSNFEAAKTLLKRSFPHRIIENLDYYEVKGIELNGHYSFIPKLQLDLSYAFQTVKNSNSSFTLEKTPTPKVLVPKHKGTISIIKDNLLTKNDNLQLTGIFYSKRTGLKEKLPGFGVINLSYSLKLKDKIGFNLQVNNLLNKRYYYLENYQMPKRNYLLSMEVKF